ncbi:MAG: 5'/3'-nucleotidase SurE [Bacillota bacterium]|nr:5'/3'-nucleotidase SurE [Bacillota bacterium]
MLILLTNDDGIFAPGLRALREAWEQQEDCEVYVVAPAEERSASGHAITLFRPLMVEEVVFPGSLVKGWSVGGTPADAVKLAVGAVLPRPPDLVISGVNRGPNLGSDVFYSGTVSAAIEGTILGIPSLAVSLAAYEDGDYGLAARFSRYLAREALRRGWPAGVLLNVNVPPLEPYEIAGVAVTRLGVRHYRNIFDRRVDPRGRVYYWLTGEAVDGEEPEDSDVMALRQNLISVTPVHLDLTHHDMVKTMRAWDLSGTLDRCLRGQAGRDTEPAG